MYLGVGLYALNQVSQVFRNIVLPAAGQTGHVDVVCMHSSWALRLFVEAQSIHIPSYIGKRASTEQRLSNPSTPERNPSTLHSTIAKHEESKW